MGLLNCGRQKAIKNIAELDSEKGIGLIEKKRLGLGKPNVIYVKNFVIVEENNIPNSSEELEEKMQESFNDVQKYENQTSGSIETEPKEAIESTECVSEQPKNQTSRSMEIELPEVPESNFKKYENQTSGSMKIEFQEVPKSNCNKTDINKTEYSKTEYNKTESSERNPIYQNNLSYPINQDSRESVRMMDMIDEMDTYREIVKENISYESYLHEESYTKREIDELVELIVDVMMMPDNATVRIAGEDKPVPIVKSQFMKLTHSHIEYVRFCLDRNTSKVGNIKAYLLTTLYNSLFTIDHFYQAEVKHDMYGGI
jgi:hypothetical protein